MKRIYSCIGVISKYNENGSLSAFARERIAIAQSEDEMFGATMKVTQEEFPAQDGWMINFSTFDITDIVQKLSDEMEAK